MYSSIVLSALLYSTETWMVYKADTIYQPLRSGRIWHKVNF